MHDLVVIGGGPGGYTAAIRAAQLGLTVALVEKETEIGGTCLHRGCIPSKAYIAAAEMIDLARRASKIGIVFGSPTIDFKALVSSKDAKVSKLAKGLSDLVKANKITRIQGEGVLEDAHHVRAADEVFETRFILLAMGTEPVRPAGFPFNGRTVLTTDELFNLTDLPKSLLVVGGGVSGCEMACAFNLLGSDATLVELLPDILPNEDRMVVKGLKSALEKRGVKILTGVSVQEVMESADGVRARFSDGTAESYLHLLSAIGRKLGADRVGLERLKIAKDAKKVMVNAQMETSVEGIYAVGDLVGTTLLAHGAMAEGICAVENIAGNFQSMDYQVIPRVVYTVPEIASIGYREADLKKEAIPYQAGRFSYLANGKALCHGEEEGFAQIYVGTEGEQHDRILGAAILGAHASDLIHEVALAMTNHLPVESLIKTVHAHPSLAEVVHEAAEDALGLAIHKSPRPPFVKGG